MPGDLKRCTVTAITPDGRRTSLEVEAASMNRAVFAYNYHARSSEDLIIPDRETSFEVEVDGKVHRTTWTRALDWANRQTPYGAARLT